MPFEYVKPEIISLRNHPELSERWVQDRIAEEPSIIGLGDLVLKDKERLHHQAGRLDLLFQDADTNRRYEVEIQLGRSDESHIIRTIEYWDIERKRYPQYDHTAVIIAEDITSRFLNVISLFNGFIPLVAIQMRAVKVGNQVSLIFTTVLDEARLGLVDEDEEVQEVTDRSYWENKASKATVAMVDQMLNVIQAWDSDLYLKYNKFYIGLAKQGQSKNFVVFRPQKGAVRLEPCLQRSDEVQAVLDEAGLDVMEYDRRWGRYRIRVTGTDLQKKQAVIGDILRKAYDEANLDS